MENEPTTHQIKNLIAPTASDIAEALQTHFNVGWRILGHPQYANGQWHAFVVWVPKQPAPTIQRNMMEEILTLGLQEFAKQSQP